MMLPTNRAFSSTTSAGPARAAAGVSSDLAARAERELRENILPFWLRHAPDEENGGFFGAVGDDLKPMVSAPRGELLTSRILWAFSAAYRQDPDARYREMAQRAYRDLLGRFWDQENGGLYWTVDKSGKPVDASKQIYGQVFGIYGLCEYYQATGESEALERAIALYRLVEKHGRDETHGGYFEAFTTDWKRIAPGESVVNRVSSKSQNTHLHVMEAYTNLLRVWPDAGLKERQAALLEIMLTRIWDEKTGHLYLFLDDEWMPRSKGFSYGHDIEAAWLMTEAAGVLGDAGMIARTRKAAVAIAETTLAEGVDPEGGIYYEGGPNGMTNARKEWWPQAEAAVGFLDAYQISGDKRFLKAAEASWAYIEKRLVDRERGEWFHSITAKGEVWRQPKISLWKCPYHNTRACLELMERLGALNTAKDLNPKGSQRTRSVDTESTE